MPQPLQCQYFEAQSHTPFDCCVRFVVVVTFHAATLATRRTLLPTWAGLAPAGSRQLRLAHHHLLLAGLPAHLCENAQEPTTRRSVFSIALFPIAAAALFVFRTAKAQYRLQMQPLVVSGIRVSLVIVHLLHDRVDVRRLIVNPGWTTIIRTER